MNRARAWRNVGIGSLLLLLATHAGDANWVLYVPTCALALFWWGQALAQQDTMPDWRQFEGWGPPLMAALLMEVSLAWSPARSISVFDCLPFVLLACASTVFAGRNTSSVLLGLCTAVPLLVYLELYGVYQHLHGELAHGPFNDPNLYAGLVLSLAMPVAGLCFDCWRQRRGDPLAGLGFLVVGLALVAVAWARSRGATLSLVGAGLLAWLLLRRATPFQARSGMVLVSLAALLVAGALWQKHTLGLGLTTRTDAAVTSRVAMWRSTWHMLEDHPTTGVGFGLWHVFYPAYRTAEDVDSAGYRAHNDYLEAAATGGPFALLAVLVIPVLWWRGVRRARLADPRWAGTALGVAVGAGVLCLQAGVNFIFHQAGVALWLGALLGALHGLPVRLRNVPTAPARPRLWPWLAGLVAGSIMALEYLCLAPVLSLANAESFEARHLPWVLEEPVLRALATLNPLSSNPLYALGHQDHLKAYVARTTEKRRRYLLSAFRYYTLAQQREPAQPSLQLLKGLVFKDFPGLDEKVRRQQQAKYYARALQQDPGLVPAVREQVRLLVAEGETSRARQVLARALAVTPAVRQAPLRDLEDELDPPLRARGTPAAPG